MYLDHVFILCDVKALEAQSLLGRGFIEGSPNVHAGQGTANRRFFFANFMLELLWVNDPPQARTASVTQLWDRWSRRHDGGSRFGLVYGGAAPSGIAPPFATTPYAAVYLPRGLHIEVVEGLAPQEPAMFWLPWMAAERIRAREPVEHSCGVRRVRDVAVGIPASGKQSNPLQRAAELQLARFFVADEPLLEIRVDGYAGDVIDCRPQLPLLFLPAS